MEQNTGFLNAQRVDIEESIKNIDRKTMGFGLLDDWPVEQLKDVDSFIKFRKDLWKSKGENITGSEKDQLYQIYQYLSIVIIDCLGPMAYGRRMNEYFKLDEGAPIETIKLKLSSLIDLTRFLKVKSNELRPIIKKLADIDKNFYDKSNESAEMKTIIEPLISLQVNALLSLVSRISSNDKHLSDFIKDVKDKIINVNRMLESSASNKIINQNGGNKLNYKIYRDKYLMLKNITLPQ